MHIGKRIGLLTVAPLVAQVHTALQAAQDDVRCERPRAQPRQLWGLRLVHVGEQGQQGPEGLVVRFRASSAEPMPKLGVGDGAVSDGRPGGGHARGCLVVEPALLRECTVDHEGQSAGGALQELGRREDGVEVARLL